MIGFIEKMKEYGEKTAAETYNSEGWVAGHNSDVFGKAAPAGKISFGTPCNHAHFFDCSGWLCLHLFEHYEYTADKKWLNDFAYPIMCKAARFYLSNLEEGADGIASTTSKRLKTR